MKNFKTIEPGTRFLYVKDNGDFLKTVFMKIHPIKVIDGSAHKEVNVVSDKGFLYHFNDEENISPIRG